MIKNVLSRLLPTSKTSSIKNSLIIQAKVDCIKKNDIYLEELYKSMKDDMNRQLVNGSITYSVMKESKHNPEFEFPDGWFSRLLQRNEAFDVIGIRCLAGHVFYNHKYPNHNTQLLVLSGLVSVAINGIEYATLKTGDSIKIDKDVFHSINPIEDSYFLLITHPSLK